MAIGDNFDAGKLANQQRENLRLQNEYNEALKLSSSITKDISSLLDGTVDKRTKIGKKVKQYLDDLKSSVSSLESSEDVAKKLLDIDEQKAKVAKNYVGANKEQGRIMLEALDIAEKTLKVEQGRIALTEKVADTADSVINKINSTFDSLVENVKEIPIIGDALSKLAEKGQDAIKSKLGNAAKNFTINFSNGLKNGQSAMQSLTSAGATLGRSLLAALKSPLVIITLIVGALYLGFKRLKEIEGAARDFREETGLLISQTRNLEKNIKNISLEYAGIGVSADMVAKAAAAFNKEFEGLGMASNEVLGSMLVLEKKFGILPETSAKVNKQFQLLGGYSAKQSQYLIASAAKMAELAKVAPNKVLSDIANSSEDTLKNFRGTPDQLVKMAVSAAKFGTSLKEANDVSQKLLNWEQSITDEMEASALLGRQLNFSRARDLAFTGQLLEAQQSVLDQIEGIGDITKMSVFEKEALVKATGMELSSLIRQQQIRERFGKLQKEQLAAANSILDSGKKLEEISEKDLENQTKLLKHQEGFSSNIDKLKNKSRELGDGFMQMFMPISDFFVEVILDAVVMLSDILMPIFRGLGAALSIVFGAAKAIWNLVSSLLMPIFRVAGELIENIAIPFQRISDELDPLYQKFGELKNRVLASMEPLLPFLSKFGYIIGEVIGGSIGVLVEAFSVGFGVLFDVIESFSNFISKYLLNPIMSVVEAISGVFTSIKSAVGLGGETSSATESEKIEDGVVQNGRVVSTSPADFLIATKNPAGLVNNIGMGAGINFDSLLKEISGLRADLNSGKIGVSIDGQKVTAAIAFANNKNPITA